MSSAASEFVFAVACVMETMTMMVIMLIKSIRDANIDGSVFVNSGVGWL